MQSADYRWFVENRPELYKKYGAAYLAIKNQTVLGTFRTYADGVKVTSETEELGTFIIQLCGNDESCYTNYISSMNFAD